MTVFVYFFALCYIRLTTDERFRQPQQILSAQRMHHVSAIFQNKMHFILGFKYYEFNVITVTTKNAVFGAVMQCSFVEKFKFRNSLLFLLAEE